MQPTTEISAGLPPLAFKSPASSFSSSIPLALQVREDKASGSNRASVLDEKSTNCVDLSSRKVCATRLRTCRPDRTTRMRASINPCTFNEALLFAPFRPSIYPSFLRSSRFDPQNNLVERDRICVPHCWSFSALLVASKQNWVGRRRRGESQPGCGCRVRTETGIPLLDEMRATGGSEHQSALGCPSNWF
ncbi:hypothetical protein U1Q18_038502 [Sarracenia purpurea var. burkii]